ncbi:MAG: excinuclease ABC subunit UvrA [Christensenellales bacterium]|nr:excinuclease ABC subunit UvrA [Christensenellales bacterium]
MTDRIFIKGAREHNLKNIDLELPRNRLIVFTGLSGSGKSSLAFDTLYAEGQRRYVESLSSYARQFLGQMEKPDVDYIEGLSPAISIDQKTTSRNPRSTVGTVTEIHDYLRLMYARIGTPHCPECGRIIRQQTIDQIVDQVMTLPERTKIMVLAPVVRSRKGEYVKLLEDMQRQGYVRARIDGELYELSDPPKIAKTKKHTIEIVVDRLIVRPDVQQRLTDSLETALRLSDGLAQISVIDGEDIMFSQNYACPECNVSIEELTPRMFSFNNPYGACPTCSGLGVLLKIDPNIVIPDRTKTLNEGAIQVTGWHSSEEDSMAHMYLQALSNAYGFSLDTPVCELPEEALDKILYGTRNEKIRVEYRREGGGGTFSAPFEGIIANLERRYRETSSDAMKSVYEGYMANVLCPDCKGRRLRREALAVTVNDMNLAQVSEMPVRNAHEFFSRLKLTEKQQLIARQILKEIQSRLGFLASVGLDYLTLSRSAATLSGGEAQRIRLATQIGSSLVGVLYILDEPSIGLHQCDNRKLLDTLKHLRDLGNTLIVVEHDDETMLDADYIVDVGPGAGIHGGEIVVAGTPREVMDNPASLTGQYLSGKRSVPIPAQRRNPSGKLTLHGARANNLKNLTVDFPIGVITCVTGVSGSGKSSLVNEILHKSLARTLNRSKLRAGDHDGIEGWEQLDKVLAIDQSPIGRTPRSNPATYTGLFDLIRDVFSATPDAKARGYKANRFSFNVKGGRCEACAGDGILKIEMHFLSDVYVPCDVCKGRRYNRETLEVRYKGKNIYEVLEMTVDEALDFFRPLPRLANKLQTMHDVGLGYVKIGQPSTTLSGGEAQRIKLATELSRKATGRTLYILDEPTTGLHVADVERLNDVLQRLACAGNTLVIIEHNLDVIKTADHIIDLGPDGGDRGGTIVACGTPEEVARCPESRTGEYLKKIFRSCD